MIVKVKDKEYSFDGYAQPLQSIQQLEEECYQQGREDAIEECAKVVSSMVGICQSSCPIGCEWGTKGSCVESWKTYLTEQLKEHQNEH